MTPALERAPVRVIVAEDQPEHRAMLLAALRDPRYELHEAHDGRELLDMIYRAPAHHFAVVVCDVYMPGLRGTEVLARTSARTQFILVTASDDVRIEESAAEFGAVGFLRKPFDPSELRTLVECVTTDGPSTGVHARVRGD